MGLRDWFGRLFGRGDNSDEMRLLRLEYPPTPENAPKLAEGIVVATADISGVDLDYSVVSLKAVDEIVEELRKEGCTSDQIAETLFGFGCYVGEVFVRQAGGKWRKAAETSMAKFAGFPLVVELEDESICNPIGKVFKRLENGEEDSLPYFYQVFTSEE
jgi:hypothetical protein